MPVLDDTIEEDILLAVFQNDTTDIGYADPLYAAAHTGDPLTATSPGDNEVSASSYDRAEIHFGNTTLGNPTTIENDQDVTFPEASGSWGTIEYIGFWDSTSSGTFIGRADIASVSIGADDQLFIGSGNLVVEIN